jgi:hypothetical protein
MSTVPQYLTADPKLWDTGFPVDQKDMVCPRCRHEPGYLHHRKVETFFRREDAKEVIVAIAEGGRVKLEQRVSDASGNPSSRRDGVRIHFWCELCGDGLILNVAQHKGCTRLFWTMAEFGGEVPDSW